MGTNRTAGGAGSRPNRGITRTVVTSDAMHTQREHVDYLVTVKHAAYVCIVKRNQPQLYRQLKALPWRQVPVADDTRERGHGRDEIRRLQVCEVAGLGFPHAVQAIRTTRRIRSLGAKRWRIVTVCALTNLTACQASPAHLADYIRGHGAIGALHHIRDLTFTEDAPGPHRHRTPRHGQPAQPRHRHPAPPRLDQHRQSTTPPRPQPPGGPDRPRHHATQSGQSATLPRPWDARDAQ